MGVWGECKCWEEVGRVARRGGGGGGGGGGGLLEVETLSALWWATGDSVATARSVWHELPYLLAGDTLLATTSASAADPAISSNTVPHKPSRATHPAP